MMLKVDEVKEGTTTKAFVYDHPNLVNECKNENLFIPKFIKENTILLQIQKDIFKCIYGKFKIDNTLQNNLQNVDNSDNKKSDKNDTKIETPFLLWNCIDCSIQASYEFDQESHLNTEQLKTLLSCFKNLKYFDISGNVNFNNKCLKILMNRNLNLKYLNLKLTKIDAEGLKYLLNKNVDLQNNTLQNNNTINGRMINEDLIELKLTRLSRSALNINNHMKLIFDNLINLKKLELINNGLHYEEIKQLLTINNNNNNTSINGMNNNLINNKLFTHLNFSCNSIGSPIEISNITTLTHLILDDCNITTNECIKLILEKLTKLKLLDLSRNKNLTADAFTNISLNESLIHLKLSDTELKDDAIKFISQNATIQILEVDATKITGKGVRYILNLLLPANTSGNNNSVNNNVQEKEGLQQLVGRIAERLMLLDISMCANIDKGELREIGLTFKESKKRTKIKF